MKHKLIILSWVLICFACQKDPDTSKLDSDFPVITDHDTKADFSNYATYYIPDSVLIINGNERATYWTDNEAETIIDAFIRNMDSRGYTQVNNRANADLGSQVSYIEDLYHIYGYDDYPYWWWGYPDYWGPGYWGSWGGWYYPYPVYYQYNVGSLLAELIDLDKVQARADNKLPVLWTAYMSGLLSSSDRVNVQLTVRGIDQAFAQSPYIKK
ncbi:MAG: DUF4136 domain-containing protein [Tannerellaceae bacterium]|nr:DUF4136 domain-containing protein [Tannerellaceae bacterium]